MNRSRLAIRLVMIVALVGIFFARGGQNNPRMVKTMGIALAFAAVFIVGRLLYESSKRKKAAQNQQLAADNRNVDLFTKPKDF